MVRDGGGETRGHCADLTCLKHADGAKDFHKYFPPDVCDVSYFTRSGRIEASFPYTDEQFLKWAVMLGWQAATVRLSERPILLLVDGQGRETHILQFEHGYWLSAAIERSTDHKAINDALVIAFNSDTKIAYLLLDERAYSLATRKVFRLGGMPLRGSWLDDSEQID